MIMKEFKSIDNILDFAIKDEQRASDLYANLATRVKNKEMSKVFVQFSQEELGHKKKLENLRSNSNRTSIFEDESVQDLQIGDYIVEVNTSRNDLSYQDALIIAMKEEKAAFKLYSDLATKTTDQEFKQMFLMLAQEEAKHKLRFEIEYDDNILQEN